jgi:WD40 repeat protein
MAFGSTDKHAVVWDLKNGSLTYEIVHDCPVTAVMFYLANSLITATKSGIIRIIDTTTKNCTIAYQHPEPYIWSLQSTKFPDHIISTSTNFAVLWNLKTSQRVIFTHDKLESAELNVPGTLLLTVGEDDHVRVWDASNGSLIYAKPSCYNATFFADGNSIVTICGDDLLIFDAPSGNPIKVFKDVKAHLLKMSDDKDVYVTARTDAVKVWDSKDGTLIKSIHHDQKFGRISRIEINSMARKLAVLAVRSVAIHSLWGDVDLLFLVYSLKFNDSEFCVTIITSR